MGSTPAKVVSLLEHHEVDPKHDDASWRQHVLGFFAKSDPFPLVRVLRGRLPAARRNTNQPLAGIVMLFALSRHSSASQQRRRYTKPLNPLKDHLPQTSGSPHWGVARY